METLIQQIILTGFTLGAIGVLIWTAVRLFVEES